MNIIVILSIVPDTETKIQLNDKNVEMDQSTEWIINPYDEYAIEAAIQFKEKHGGEITSISFANGKEEKPIRKAMAMGVDKSIIIETSRPLSSISTEYMNAISTQLKSSNADIIFTGKLVTDTNNNFIGPSVAQILNLPIITEISSIHFSDNILTVTRNNAGQVEKYTSSLPILLTTDKSLNTPRYPKLPDIMKAKKKTITRVSYDINENSPQITIIKSEFPQEKDRGEIFEGTSEELVTILIDALTNKEKIL